jgi:hypothetical protein
MAKLKTFPKIILIVAVVGAIGAAANFGFDSWKAKHPTPPAEQVDIGQPQAQVAPQEQVAATPAPAPTIQYSQPTQQVQAPAPQPAAPSTDSAFDKMKGMGKL